MTHKLRLFFKRILTSPRAPSTVRPEGALSLAELGAGMSATVLRVQGDAITKRRMETMGIVPGAVVTKRSEVPAHGTIVIAKGPMQLAMSHDIGGSVIVEPAERRQ